MNEHDHAALEMLRCRSSRDSATAARILLRLSLSATTGRRVSPSDWRFARNRFGKPFVENDKGLDFSVSHVDAVVMVAIGCDVNVGIDIESVDQPLEDEVIDHFCHASELQALDALSAAQRRSVFLEFWTKKEAYTKMLGLGHSLEFQSLNVLKLHATEHETARVCLQNFYLSADHSLYHAALVIDRQVHRRPIDIQLMSAVLPHSAALTMSPAGSLGEISGKTP